MGCLLLGLGEDPRTLAKKFQGQGYGGLAPKKNEPMLVIGEHGLVDPRMASALLIGAKVSEQEGNRKAKPVLEEHAAVIYQVVNGVDCGFQHLVKCMNELGRRRALSMRSR